MEFSIMELLQLLKKHFKYIAICTILGLCSFYIVNQFIKIPTYTASVKFYVDSDETDSSTGLNELTYAQKVVTTYINFLQTRVFYEQVIRAAGMNYTQDEFTKIISIESVNNTEIFEIDANTGSPDDSYLLARTMQDIVPDIIKNIKSSAKISVIDPAVYPLTPAGPNIVINTLMGGLFGFLISLIILFFREIIAIKVKDQEDLDNKYDTPILGSIPNFNRNKKKKFHIKNVLPFLRRKKKEQEEDTKYRGILSFVISEAYKSLRTNIHFTLRESGCKKIIVSSPLPEEGKSTTCINLGITIAQTGSKVLILDCDLRNGSIHKFFDLNNQPGISDALSGVTDLARSIQNTLYENLQVISLGTIPPNPAELLASSQMEELIKTLEKDYDYLIIDTPPVNIVSDSINLSKYVDGVLIVVRENVTTHPNIISAIRKYKLINGNILGFVINGASLDFDKKYETKYHYYNYPKGNDD